MIVTVTPNLALDITYTVDRLVIGTPMRVPDVRERAGGKGVNVARVLHQLGASIQAIAMCGGNNGKAVAGELVNAGLPHRLVSISGATRRAIAVVDSSTGEATVFNEVGPMITASEWAGLESAIAAALGDAEVLIVSGSLPPGAPVDGYARIVTASREAGVPVIVDATGEALLLAAGAGPDIVKPNQTELLEATGASDVAAGAQILLDMGAAAVVVSLGSDGAIAFSETATQTWTARPSRPIQGNATGAGDAMVAALALGIARRWGWQRRLNEAVALAAAAVAHPQAGSFDEDMYLRARRYFEAAEPRSVTAVTT